MPMGDWDRLKNHISDYLEGNLDNSTRKEFEAEIEKNTDLSKITRRVEKLSNILTNLPEYKCSDDFNQKLRERIHQESSVKTDSFPIKKYSFAFSFVVLAVIIVFAFNSFTGDDDPVNKLPESSNIQADPVYQSPTQSTFKNQPTSQPVDLKTMSGNEVVTDSLSRQQIKKMQDKGSIKQVDDVKK
jgi:anti-sigma factor RsiW